MTTQYQIIYWRNIPAQVKVKTGGRRFGKPLPNRFPVAIDEAAMRAGKTESDAYLAEWRSSGWQEQDDNPEELAEALVAELEAAYPAPRLQQLIQNGGWEADGDAS
ncbi:MAG: hypothetical protein GY803_01840 [Chloroflexi bacterium]|nr:hypothetical protein [Chloroflexota bacterium]